MHSPPPSLSLHWSDVWQRGHYSSPLYIVSKIWIEFRQPAKSSSTVRGHLFTLLQGTHINLYISMKHILHPPPLHSHYPEVMFDKEEHYSSPIYIVFSSKIWIEFRLNPTMNIIEGDIIMNTLYFWICLYETPVGAHHTLASTRVCHSPLFVSD